MPKLREFEYLVEWIDKNGKVHSDFFLHKSSRFMQTSYIHKCANTFVELLSFVRVLEKSGLKYNVEISTEED